MPCSCWKRLLWCGDGAAAVREGSDVCCIEAAQAGRAVVVRSMYGDYLWTTLQYVLCRMEESENDSSGQAGGLLDPDGCGAAA